MDFCIRQWDPRNTGTIEEPHHNTYDIEFWGPEPLCTGFYLGALTAFIKLSEAMGEDAGRYKELLAKGNKQMETSLYNGEYFLSAGQMGRTECNQSGGTCSKKPRNQLFSKKHLKF